MLKKLFSILSSCIITFFCFLGLKMPVFNKYADNFIMYTLDSNNKFVSTKVDIFTYLISSDVIGEGIILPKEKQTELIKDFNAQLILVENINQGTNYYYYSPKIRKSVRVQSKTVNLHIFISENTMMAGSPIIFGSY